MNNEKVQQITRQFKPELATFISYNELDELVSEVYGIEFSFIADQESSNDTDYVFRVVGDEADEYTLGRIKNGDGWNAYAILADMVFRKIIPAGTYVVEVCW